jgi:hypothetical protein
VSDLISRQEAIDGILQFMPTKLRDDATVEEQINYVAWRCALGCAVSSVGTQLPAEPEQRWIPCSERLPELYKDVLVWYVNDYHIACLVQIDNIKYWHFESSEMDSNIDNVMAWMPLPEPWKGGAE